MATRGETRARVLVTARELFGRQGFHATGVNQVLAEAGAPKGSLYFHFPGGKNQLAAEAVGQGADELCRVIDEILARTPDPAQAVREFAALLAARLADSDFLDGCPIATVALDADADSESVRTACGAGYDRWLASIRDHLVQSGEDTAAAEELAVLVLSSLEGALLLARTRRDVAPLRQVADRIAALLAAEGR
ncbi:TetR/AcrR family transcriptional regulator [Saccharopolyspora sp. SCSIO 74807]|uniref:TetR/AcrR family transcriptional regulator n=1 Tax=Saccharopolyspora sp. SCSIO 74807 TaxID=3118084 RepID=UPI0030CCF282